MRLDMIQDLAVCPWQRKRSMTNELEEGAASCGRQARFESEIFEIAPSRSRPDAAWSRCQRNPQTAQQRSPNPDRQAVVPRRT